MRWKLNGSVAMIGREREGREGVERLQEGSKELLYTDEWALACNQRVVSFSNVVPAMCGSCCDYLFDIVNDVSFWLLYEHAKVVTLMSRTFNMSLTLEDVKALAQALQGLHSPSLLSMPWPSSFHPSGFPAGRVIL